MCGCLVGGMLGGMLGGMAVQHVLAGSYGGRSYITYESTRVAIQGILVTIGGHVLRY